MGASLAFTGLWCFGSLFLSAGLVFLSARIGVAIGVGFAFVVVGKVLEWFVVEAVLSWWFKDYRRGPT